MSADPVAGEPRPRRTSISSLVTFYLLAFGISWLGFVPILAGSYGRPFFQSRLWLAALILPGIGPAVAAAIAGSSPEEKDRPLLLRLRSSFLKPVSLRWWAITVLLSIGVMLAASLLTFSLKVDHAHILRGVSAPHLLLYSIMSLAANPLEEIGWRGFAQNRLQQMHTPITAALIVGLLWAVWHIPLFLLSSSPVSMSQIPFWSWAAGVIPQAIILAWLYNRTGRSLATVSVFHALGNIAGSLFYSPAFMVSAVRIALALLVLWLAGPRLGHPDVHTESPSAKKRGPNLTPIN